MSLIRINNVLVNRSFIEDITFAGGDGIYTAKIWVSHEADISHNYTGKSLSLSNFIGQVQDCLEDENCQCMMDHHE